jgi:hypothetical protein
MTELAAVDSGPERLKLDEHEILPRVMPAGWMMDNILPGRRYRRTDGFTVLASVQRQRDGQRWLHVSFSRPDRLPSWEELKEVKQIFIGRERTAIQVIPRDSEYVNVHPYCLHLWTCLDSEVVPDFAVSGLI